MLGGPPAGLRRAWGVSIPPAVGAILRVQWFPRPRFSREALWGGGEGGIDGPRCWAGSPSFSPHSKSGQPVLPPPASAQTTNSGTSSWVRSKEKYLLVLLTGKVSWMLMHCWAKQPLQ